VHSYRIRKKSGDTDPANRVILREAPRKALHPAGKPGATEESLRWAHHPVGYDWLWREIRPVSDKDPSVGARAARALPTVRGGRLPQDDSDRPRPLFLRIPYHTNEGEYQLRLQVQKLQVRKVFSGISHHSRCLT
jgi:hypothetical protein